ncbi:MAG: LCP family protein [Candidatus Saccharibacteria bacterium]
MLNAKPLKIISKVIAIIAVVSYIVAVYLVVDARLIPVKYLAIIILITSLLIIWLLFLTFKNKLSSRGVIAATLTSTLIILANVYVISTSISTNIFLNSIQEAKYTQQEYSIIAKTDQVINLDSGVNRIGIINTDVNNDLVRSEVNKQTKVSYVKYDNISGITAALDDKSVNMAVIKSSYLQLLSENYDSFYQTIKVIGRLNIKVKKDTIVTKSDVSKPFVLYISGIDTYGDVSTVSRSDVNIMVGVNPQTHKILLVNTPRDYYVQLHGTTGVRDKLTHAGIYGIDMSVQTMADLYSVPINYYLRINFSSLTNIVDVLGDVDVISEYNFLADDNQYVVGVNHLNGSQALSFARERHSFEAGDRTRGQNQQRVIEAIIAKMNNPNTLVKYQQILASLQRTIQTDMDSDSITTLIKNQLDNMIKWSVESISVTGVDSHNVTYSMGNLPLYVMEPDADSLNAAKTKIQQYIK